MAIMEQEKVMLSLAAIVSAVLGQLNYQTLMAVMALFLTELKKKNCQASLSVVQVILMVMVSMT